MLEDTMAVHFPVFPSSVIVRTVFIRLNSLSVLNQFFLSSFIINCLNLPNIFSTLICRKLWYCSSILSSTTTYHQRLILSISYFGVNMAINIISRTGAYRRWLLLLLVTINITITVAYWFLAKYHLTITFVTRLYAMSHFIKV